MTVIKGGKNFNEIYEFNDNGSMGLCVKPEYKTKQTITNKNNDTGSWEILDNTRVKLTISNKDEIYKFDQTYSEAVSTTQVKGCFPKLVTADNTSIYQFINSKEKILATNGVKGFVDFDKD